MTPNDTGYAARREAEIKAEKMALVIEELEKMLAAGVGMAPEEIRAPDET